MEKYKNILRYTALILAAVLILTSGSVYAYRKLNPPEDIIKTVAPEAKPDSVLSNVKASFKDTDYPEGIQDKFKDAYAMNNDLVGWLTIPNTRIDTPILQSKDNNYYLRNNYFGIYTQYGDPFMDYRNDPKDLSRNTILYSHNLRGDSINNMIFADVMKYRTISGYRNAPIINFSTLYNDYTFKVFASFITNANDSGDNGYTFYYIEPEMNDNQFTEFISEVKKRSLYTTDVDILPDDKIITLSTCTYELDRGSNEVSARLVVMARLVRSGESADVDTSKPFENENPRFPQAYYDKHNLNNPYKNDKNWVIS